MSKQKQKPIALTYVHPNKARIETGHKTFDRFCNFIGTGNVIADGQVSACIRAGTETECNDRTWAPGELRKFDLQWFREHPRMPRDVEMRVLKDTATQGANLSVYYHCAGDRMIVHGYILTRGSSENHKFLWMKRTGPTDKSQRVLDWCAKRVSI